MSLPLNQLLAKRVQALRLVNEAARLLKPKPQEEKKDERVSNSNPVGNAGANANTGNKG